MSLKFPKTSFIDAIEGFETPENEAAQLALNEDWMEDLTGEETKKAKILCAKVKKFRNELERNERGQVLSWASKIQAAAQVLGAVVGITVNAIAYVNLNESPKCKIDEVIDETYAYFKCSHSIVLYFERKL